jgi:uncharacterized membrane protein YkvA (DUF1232 family)
MPAGPRPLWREAVAMLPDLGRLLRSLSQDPRVPWHAKLVAAGSALYVASPVDLLPDVIPGVGGVDDLLAVLVAVRQLVATAGYDVVREHWTGTDDGFGVLIVLAGVGTARPSKLARADRGDPGGT